MSIRSFRPFNLILVALSQLGLIFFLQFDYTPQPGDYTTISALVMVTILVMAAGYLINDFYDFEADRVNKPDRTEFSLENRSVFLWTYLIMNGIALVGSFLFLGGWSGAFVIACIYALFLYSRNLKKYPLAANLMIAFLCLAPFVLVWLNFDGLQSGLFLFYAVLCFIITFAREMVKDMEDVEGDRLMGIVPLQDRFGSSAILQRIREITLFATVLSAYGTYALLSYFSGTYAWVWGLYMVLTVVLPLALTITVAFQEDTNLPLMSRMLKYSMFTGILSMTFF
jgi:4-hydroxybenzoate polyprenyltransferase